MDIYERICIICAEKGITITGLCRELTGYDENLSSWKKGRFKPDLIIRISERLGVSTDYLLKGGFDMQVPYSHFERLLSQKGVTPYQVAKATGVSTVTLTYWKNGRSAPKTDKLSKIAEYFDVPVSYLVDGAMFDGAEVNSLLSDLTADEIKKVTEYVAFLKSQRANK